MKILIMRFSSFGDVLQTLSVAGRLGQTFPQAEIHWVTREEFVPLISTHPRVTKVWSLRKGADFTDLLKLGHQLRREHFTHVYDAHNNLRSHLLGLQLKGFLSWRVWTGRVRFLRRSIFRWRRFLLFQFRWNLFPKPFSGQKALLAPLAAWGVPDQAPDVPQLFLSGTDSSRIPREWTRYVALAPSAAFELKRWPLEYWKELIRMSTELHFVVLGGPEDQFLKELEPIAPDRVICLAGQMDLLESARVVASSQALVANDTGLMHVAEQIGKPCVALMGPAPFGFPCRERTIVMELDLACRPCSKHGQGPCVNPEYQKCLRGIPPQDVVKQLRRVLHAKLDAPISAEP